MIITNGQLHNAQIINTGQIVSTSQGQQMIQANTQNVQSGQNVQLHLVQTGNGTVQMIQQNGQPAQVLQIQRTSDDRCEIIVQQPDVHGETQYYTEDGKSVKGNVRFVSGRIKRLFPFRSKEFGYCDNAATSGRGGE